MEKKLKYCPNCGNKLKNDEEVCLNCGKEIKVVNKKSNKNIYIIIAIIVAIIVIGFGIYKIIGYILLNKTLNNANEIINNVSNTTDSNDKKYTSKNEYDFNETFEFDGLEITIGSEYEFTTVNNRYSEYNNQVTIKLPITVKNISQETTGLNMFYYDVYGSQGTEVKSLNSYFDENIDDAGDLRSGASYTKYIYFLYDGNGKYDIEFDNWSEHKVVEFNITK